MNNSKFRAIPKTDFEIPFKLEEQAISSWLNRLTKYDGKEACLQILLLTQAINTSSRKIKNKIAILNVINDYLIKYISEIEDNCWDAGMPLTTQEIDYTEIIVWNCLTLAESFFIASNDSNITSYYISSIDKKIDETLPLCTALQLIRQAQLHIAAVYRIPSEGFWQLIYKIVVKAEKENLLDIVINKNEFKNMTLNDLFKRILIFHVCNTNQFRPKELRTIFKFLPSVCQSVDILESLKQEKTGLISLLNFLSKTKTINYEKDDDLFFIDLNSDNPPKAIKRMTSGVSDNLRYFSPVSVANAIIDQVHHEKSEITKNINDAILQRIIKTLGQGQKRKFNRKNKTYNVPGVIGFENIIKFIRKEMLESVIDEPIELENKKLTLFSLEDNIKNAHDVVQLVPIREITIFDSSISGYLLTWNESGVKTKVGDIFGIVPFDNAKCLELSLIRRIITSSDDDEFKFGVEIIGHATEVVYASYLNHKESGDWSILIPSDDSLKQPATLIYSLNFFKIGDEICLYKDKDILSYLLIKELNSGASVTHAELQYLGDKTAS